MSGTAPSGAEFFRSVLGDCISHEHEQVGRCVRCKPCGRRLYQGTLMTADEKDAVREWLDADSQTPAAQDDTTTVPGHAAGSSTGRPDGTPQSGPQRSRTSADPRAAGATSPRGAQPPAPPGYICQYCRRRVHRQRNGAWYHDRSASVACYPGNGPGDHRRATPLAAGGAR